MKRIPGFILAVMFFSSLALGQETPAPKRSFLKGDGFHTYAQFNFAHWLNGPDTIKSNILKSRGGDIYLKYHSLFFNSNVGFSVGIGASHFALGTDASIVKSGDTTLFFKLAGDYKKNKMNMSYADVPLELFYQTKDKTPFRIGVGIKGGYLLSSNVKYKAAGIKTKVYDIPNLMKIRYGATLTMTYGWFGVNAYYGLVPVFEEDLGPQFTPISFGITFAPY